MRHLALSTTALLAAALLAASLVACGDETASAPAPAADTPHRVPNYEDSKADNYVSTNAREFTLSGQAHADLPSDYAQRDVEAQASAVNAAVDRRLSTLTWALRRHVEGVVREATDLHGKDTWFSFFKRDPDEAEGAEVVEVDGALKARFTFKVELVGSYYLMSKLAPDTGAAQRTFQLTLAGEPTATTVAIEGSPSRDAFPKYDELFADGVYDIAVHFGGDYNEGRFDLETAKWLVSALLEGGWKNEAVTDFASLTVDSPAFTRALLIEGQTVEARVRIFHSDMVGGEGQPPQARLAEVMKASLASADVVIYSGHAGPGAGFVLDYQPRDELRASDFATLELASKYQIYVFDGCQTYRTYVDDLMKNPNKTFENVDIVTTVNTTPFSVGYQTLHQFVYWLTLTDAAGRHFPVSWGDLLRGLNTRDFKDVHYGVHGVDQDPQLNPHASDVACQACQSDADCGAGGNLCLGYGTGAGCGVACTTDTACPAGYRCARLYDDPDLFYIPKQCVRRDYACP
ncbi:MAG: hypothetical protein H6702_05845 [Myxococcales bacterium]|nr:hypothetical protein [Myxococcales bacterium]